MCYCIGGRVAETAGQAGVSRVAATAVAGMASENGRVGSRSVGPATARICEGEGVEGSEGEDGEVDAFAVGGYIEVEAGNRKDNANQGAIGEKE